MIIQIIFPAYFLELILNFKNEKIQLQRHTNHFIRSALNIYFYATGVTPATSKLPTSRSSRYLRFLLFTALAAYNTVYLRANPL